MAIGGVSAVATDTKEFFWQFDLVDYTRLLRVMLQVFAVTTGAKVQAIVNMMITPLLYGTILQLLLRFVLPHSLPHT